MLAKKMFRWSMIWAFLIMLTFTYEIQFTIYPGLIYTVKQEAEHKSNARYLTVEQCDHHRNRCHRVIDHEIPSRCFFQGARKEVREWPHSITAHFKCDTLQIADSPILIQHVV